MRKNEQGVAHLALLAIAVLVLIIGAGVYVAKNKDNKTANRETTENESSLVTPLPADILTTDKVKELAAQEAPNEGITSVELEQENGVYLYKVKLANGTIVFFNAQTGAKVTHDAGEIEAEDGAIAADFVAAISFDKARELALAQKPGGVIKKIELETEEGKVVYSVRFSDDARIDIDATTGEVVRTKAGNASSGSTATPTPTGGNSGSSNNNSGSGSSSSSGSSSDDSDDGSSADDATSESHDSSDDSDDDSDDDSSHGSGSNSGSGNSGSGHSNDD